MSILYYFHDPMCSWCWGYRPAAERLFENLPAGVGRQNVLGGLAPDSDAPMPVEQQAAIRGHWDRIRAMLGTEFNFDFWVQCSPRRSTYPACRAVIAAAMQGCEEPMIHAIQIAYYRQARNPSDIETLLELAEELGLAVDEFRNDLQSRKCDDELRRQIAFSRRHGVSSFPSLVFEHQSTMTNLEIDYRDPGPTLEKIAILRKSNHTAR